MSTKIDHWQEMLEIIHKDTEGVLSDHRNIYKAYVEMINDTPEQVRADAPVLFYPYSDLFIREMIQAI